VSPLVAVGASEPRLVGEAHVEERASTMIEGNKNGNQRQRGRINCFAVIHYLSNAFEVRCLAACVCSS